MSIGWKKGLLICWPGIYALFVLDQANFEVWLLLGISLDFVQVSSHIFGLQLVQLDTKAVSVIVRLLFGRMYRSSGNNVDGQSEGRSPGPSTSNSQVNQCQDNFCCVLNQLVQDISEHLIQLMIKAFVLWSTWIAFILKLS